LKVAAYAKNEFVALPWAKRSVVPLLTGQMTFRNYIPPALANRDPYSDPYALMWEARYLECMVSRLKSKKAVVVVTDGEGAVNGIQVKRGDRLVVVDEAEVSAAGSISAIVCFKAVQGA
jgi:hypothetical protein